MKEITSRILKTTLSQRWKRITARQHGRKECKPVVHDDSSGKAE
jgi:hypothetical protein